MGTTTAEPHLQLLPGCAQYIIDHKLDEYITEQLRITREVKLPLLRFFDSLTEEQILVVGRRTALEFLQAITTNTVKEFVISSRNRWLGDKLELIARNEVVVEDVLLIGLIRTRTFRKFIHSYTTEMNTCLQIVDELDNLTNYINSLYFNALTNIQQDLYKRAQELSKIGNWTWDLHSNKRVWSDELYRIYELEKQLYTPENLADYNHPDDMEIVRREMERSIKTCKPHDFYYRIVLKSGKEKILHAKGEVRTNEEGKPRHLFGTVQDVTVQKQYEKELNEKQYFIQKITDITPSVIIAYNLRMDQFPFINQTLEKQLGYSNKEIDGKGIGFFINLIHPDDLEALTEKYIRIVQAFDQGEDDLEQVIEFKYRILHKNGKYRWFHTYGTIFNKNKNNQIEDVVSVSVDITDEVNAIIELIKKNDELRKSEERYHGMINEVEDYSIILLNKDGIIENWNKGAEKIKGYTAEEALGKNIAIFYTEADQKNNLPAQLLEKAAREGRATSEGWRVRKNETIFWGSVAITALHDKRNNITGFSKVTRDLTERKLAENKMQEYTEHIESKNKRLEQINKELESFSYMASHDLQEPLRKIQAFSNRLVQKEYAVLSDWGKDIFDRIQSSANRMQNLIDALLNFSQINSTPEAFEKADTNKLLKEVISNLNESIEEKKAEITCDPMPVMNVIPFYFQQLLTNMLTNALKYSKTDVAPKIKIAVHVIPGIEIPDQETEPGKHYYCISVTDNGIGFDPQYSHKIFELFQRLHGKSEYPGTGIGLAICKKIMDIHQGFILAESEPGTGSTFNLFFPVE
ncbi:MAG: sensor signal transduction histidine kinase [Bacteroidetes bacterium]|nr:sensor signal transduction histidine kinase [Bacteroidota bacterium]